MLGLSKNLIILLASVILLYFNWTSWHSLFVGVVGLVLYYALNTIAWGVLAEKILSLSKTWSRLFGFLLGFYLSAMAAGIPVVVWKYDRIAIAISLFLVGVIGLIVRYYLSRYQKTTLSLRATPQMRGSEAISWLIRRLFRPFVRSGRIAPPRNDIIDLNKDDKFKFKNSYFWLLGILSALFVFVVFHARTGVFILSPWDALSSFSLMLFFAITFLVALLLFSRRSVTIILGVIIAFSYLTHLYLPVVYETGFGGDKWRHLGAETWLAEGNVYTPSVWGQERRNISFGSIAVPEALVAGNKTSYAPQWAVTIFLAESLAIDIFWVDLLLVFLLWSFFLPLILYQFGRLIFLINSSPFSERRGVYQVILGIPHLSKEGMGVVLAFLPTFFYTFQSEGAITIPVSFGHLFFFFILLVWLYYVKQGKRCSLITAIILSLFFYWGYILNFFVLLGVGMLSIAYRKLFITKSHWEKLKQRFSRRRIIIRDYVIFGLLTIVSVLAIPFLEIFQGLSKYNSGSVTWRGIIDALADAFGQLSGFIGVIVPPDFIDQGNFLYNQTELSLSRLPLFSYWLVPFIVSSLVWAIIAWGIYRLIRYHRDNKILILLLVLFLIMLLSYFISWSFTDGVHILARRLNETIVFFMIIFLGWAIWQFLEGRMIKIPPRKKILAISFILAFAATSTYASGPKLQLVTADELQAAKYMWSQLKIIPEPYCVIGNTWPLLGLEAVSGRRITGGGFPVYTEYAQPERVKIFETLSKRLAPDMFAVALRLTGAQACYYMNERRWINEAALFDTIKVLGEPKQIGKVMIWRVEK